MNNNIETYIYEYVTDIEARNELLDAVRRQAARIAELEAALKHLLDIATIAEYYLPGELAENAPKVSQYVREAQRLIKKSGAS